MILEYYSMPWCEHKPVRANPSDAGLDLRFNPQEHTLVPIQIQPGESLVLGTGLKFGVPHGYMIQIMNRSGNAAKKQLMVGACVVDSGYNGEVFVNLHNIGNTPKTIDMGDKIAQLVLIPVVQWRSFPVAEEMLYVDPLTISDRGDGALGSTGK